MKIPAAILSTLALALLSGCRPAPAPGRTPSTDPPVQMCTKIGCSDGLTVVVENAPSAPYTVEASMPDGTTRTARCEDGTGCSDGLFLEGVTADEVTVRITGSAGTGTQTVRPTYTENRPNGPGCPPVCRQARVQVRYAP